MKSKKLILVFLKYILLFFYLPTILCGIIYVLLFRNSDLDFLFLFTIIILWILGFLCFIFVFKKNKIFNSNLNNDKSDNELSLKIKSLEKELADLKEFIHKTTDIFFSVTHEIKNPLTVIGGYASAILQFDSHFNEDKKLEFIKRIGSEANRLNKLIRDYLNNLKEVDNLDEIEFKKVDIKNILEYFFNIYEIKAKEDKINFLFNVEDNLPGVLANNEKIELVISNLIANALKYVCERGFIELEAKIDNDNVVVSVISNYDDKTINKDIIFDKFMKSVKFDFKGKGMGLGLFISKTIIEKHHGEIGMKNDENKGILTLYFTLPIYKGKK